MSLALSKTLDPTDFDLLVPELAIVDEGFTSETEQHPMRRWEYAMALRAVETWGREPHVAYDIGGAGSPFAQILSNQIGMNVRIIDPVLPGGRSVETFIGMNPAIADVVTCLSVLEHVDDLDRFLYHLGCLVAPGGLLFLTFDCWNQVGPDTAHFHWDRKRIFTPHDWEEIYKALFGFYWLGERDYEYHGNHLYGSYSFASLALIKRP